MQREKRMKKSEQDMQALWDNYRSCYIHIIGIMEGDKRGTEDIFEAITTENFLKLMIDAKPQNQEAQRISNRINTPPQMTPMHITFKLQKIKDRQKIFKVQGWGPYL